MELVEKDFTTEALSIAKLVNELTMSRANFTLKMIVELLKGRPVKSKYQIPTEVIERYTGQYKQYSELDLHRLVIKLLIIGVLEE